MTALRVFLAGEGRNELGSRAAHPSFQSDKEPGVLGALLTRVRSDGWTIVGALQWKDLPKLKAHGPSPDEAQQVERLILRAEEAGADIVAFSRDADDEKDARRAALHRGIEMARTESRCRIAVIGEVAAPTIEGWILALTGRRSTETMTAVKAQRELQITGIAAKDTAAMVRAIERCSAETIAHPPDDALGLIRWLTAARDALAPTPTPTG